jgi:hypothetical protein
MIYGFHLWRALRTHPAGFASKFWFIRVIRVIRGSYFDFLVPDGPERLRRDDAEAQWLFMPEPSTRKTRLPRAGKQSWTPINSNRKESLRRRRNLQRREVFDTNSANCHELKCAEGTTEISPGLARSDYAGQSSPKKFLLRIRWGEGGRRPDEVSPIDGGFSSL